MDRQGSNDAGRGAVVWARLLKADVVGLAGFVGLESDPEIVFDQGGEQPDDLSCENEGTKGSRMA